MKPLNSLENLCVLTKQNICLSEPLMQLSPEGIVSKNPFYDSKLGISFWTYKLLTLWDNNLNSGIYELFIPINKEIPEELISISERILTKGTFEEVPFDFCNPKDIIPSKQFKYLRIPIQNRFKLCSSVQYRMAIKGNYEETKESLIVNDSNKKTIEFNDSFLVPGVSLHSTLILNKTAFVKTDHDKASIHYTLSITNIGKETALDIILTDIISYDSYNIIVDQVVVDLNLVKVDTSLNDLLKLSTKIENLKSSETLTIEYTIPIVSFYVPNIYTFSSTVTAKTNKVETTENSTISIEVVEFKTVNTCTIINNNSAKFDLSLCNVAYSPASTSIMEFSLLIPPKFTIKFHDLGSKNCIATFDDTKEAVPLNTNITDKTINFRSKMTIPFKGKCTESIIMDAVSTSCENNTELKIISSLTNVSLLSPNKQVFLEAIPIPNTTVLNLCTDYLKKCAN